MNKAKELFKIVGYSLKKNSPTILTGLGVAGFFTSIVMAVNATPKAMELIDEELFIRMKKESNPNYIGYEQFISVSEKQGYHIYKRMSMLSFREKVEVAWEPYLPAAGMALISATAIIMGNRISVRRTAALASLYSIAETSLREYQDKVTETVGKKKAELLRGEVAQAEIDNNPLNDETLLQTPFGETLFYEELSGRYFLSDIEAIRKAENIFNQQLLSENVKTLNELYYEMGLEGTKIGDAAGWEVDKGLLEFIFSAKLAKGDRPCVVVGYKKMPQALYF